MAPSMTFRTSKMSMASFSLGGRGGRPQVAHDHGTVKCGLHAKFHRPRLETVDLHRESTALQTQTGHRIIEFDLLTVYLSSDQYWRQGLDEIGLKANYCRNLLYTVHHGNLQ